MSNALIFFLPYPAVKPDTGVFSLMGVNTGFCPLANVNNLFKIWQNRKLAVYSHHQS
uniref:Uncharacterized protein n=1 Tax=Siphoviridae sp. ctt0c4 TaxID=2825702 RepID=A0A8S5V390_9CAUD|nr:MAG TPA: hypothetical protein [Siphoviridae sp. ctt0c4]